MKMILTTTKTTTYNIGDDFFLDIAENPSEMDAYLYQKNNGIKIHCGNVLKSQFNLEQFIFLIDMQIENKKAYYKKAFSTKAG